MGQMLLSNCTDQPMLADVLPNCLQAMGVPLGDETSIPAPTLPLELPTVRGAVVVLVDGLGAEQLRARSGHARHLTRAWDRAHCAQSFPSTTVSGITSLTTASRAGRHGMVAYTVWDREQRMHLNQLSGWGANMQPHSWQLEPTVFERLTASGRAQSVVVQHSDYRESGLTAASLRGADYRPGDSMAERAEAAAAAARDLAHPLIYLYHAELDQVGHSVGWESEAWTARLEELDASLARLLSLLPSDIGVLVTADHGMVDIPLTEQRDLDDRLLTRVAAVAGEPRLRHLYLADGADHAECGALATALQESLGDEAVVVPGAEAIRLGWYGADVQPRARARVGDVVVAATAPVTYFTAAMPARMRQMIGQHGSITPAETEVPLVRLGAFG